MLTVEKCGLCHGSGNVVRNANNPYMQHSFSCPRCYGYGTTISSPAELLYYLNASMLKKHRACEAGQSWWEGRYRQSDIPIDVYTTMLIHKRCPAVGSLEFLCHRIEARCSNLLKAREHIVGDASVYRRYAQFVGTSGVYNVPNYSDLVLLIHLWFMIDLRAQLEGRI